MILGVDRGGPLLSSSVQNAFSVCSTSHLARILRARGVVTRGRVRTRNLQTSRSRRSVLVTMEYPYFQGYNGRFGDCVATYTLPLSLKPKICLNLDIVTRLAGRVGSIRLSPFCW